VIAEARDLLGGNGILLDNHVIRHMSDIEVLHTYEGTETCRPSSSDATSPVSVPSREAQALPAVACVKKRQIASPASGPRGSV
jgi:hypothetical protein